MAVTCIVTEIIASDCTKVTIF